MTNRVISPKFTAHRFNRVSTRSSYPSQTVNDSHRRCIVFPTDYNIVLQDVSVLRNSVVYLFGCTYLYNRHFDEIQLAEFLLCHV